MQEIVSKELIIPDKDIEPEPAKPDMEDLFTRNLFLYPTIKEAALAAGYSESSAESTVYTKMKSSKFQDKVREYAKEHDLLNIPRILSIEDKVLSHLEDNPLDIGKFKDTIKQKKTIAGLLKQEDQGTKTILVNVKYLQNMMLNAHK
jgi:hypothetical protein